MRAIQDIPPAGGVGRRFAPAAALGLLAAAAYAPTLAWLFHRWSLGVWYQLHGFFVPPIAAWLWWRGLKTTRGLRGGSSNLAFLFLVPAALLLVVDAALRFEILAAMSLILFVPGAALLLLGRARTRANWFPLAFLAFAVPVPLVVVERVHFVLRHVAAAGSEKTLSLLGYDVVRDGTLLILPVDRIQIADACSGFSTLMALFVAALLMAYTSTACRWRRALVLALVFPVAAAVNVFRCTLLVVLVAAYGGEVLHGWLHPASGILAFLIALAALWFAEDLGRGAPAEAPA